MAYQTYTGPLYIPLAKNLSVLLPSRWAYELARLADMENNRCAGDPPDNSNERSPRADHAIRACYSVLIPISTSE